MHTYLATNTLNGKFYIGSTIDFERRKGEHLRDKKSNFPFQNSLRKNPEAFEWEVWSDDSEEPTLEQALLDMWCGTEQCYNLSPHSGRPVMTKEQRSEAGRTSGKKAFKDKTGIFSLPPESLKESSRRGRLSAGRSSHESGRLAKISKVGANKCLELHPNLLKEISEKGNKTNREKNSKSVICVETETMYYSIREASRQTGIPAIRIRKCCKKECGVAGGLTWEFGGK